MYRFNTLLTADSYVGFPEAVSGRLRELFCPLWRVSLEPFRTKIIHYAGKLIERRMEEEKASDEALVVSVVNKCSLAVEDGILSVSAITGVLNEEFASEKEKWPSHVVGRILSRLGFEKTRVHKEGRRGIKWDEVLLDRLKKRYHVE